MEFRTPIKQARGLGASHHGAAHWWIQRLTAIGMVPLMLWLVTGIAANAGGGYLDTISWLGSPLNAVWSWSSVCSSTTPRWACRSFSKTT